MAERVVVQHLSAIKRGPKLVVDKLSIMYMEDEVSSCRFPASWT